MNEAQYNEDSRIKFFPLKITKIADNDYDIRRFGTASRVLTRKIGAEAVSLLRSGLTLKQSKEILSARYGCTPAGIEIAPLMKSMLKTHMIRAIDGVVLATPKIAPQDFLRNTIHFQVGPASLDLLYRVIMRCASFDMMYPLLYMLTAVAYRKKREAGGEDVVRNMKRAFPESSEAEVFKLAEQYSSHQFKVFIKSLMGVVASDCLLAGGKAHAKASRWVQKNSCIRGLSHLDDAIAAGKGVILCGFHFDFWFLIPVILCMRGYSITTLGLLGRKYMGAEFSRISYSFAQGTFTMIPNISLKSLAYAMDALKKGDLVLLFADGNVRSDKAGEKLARFNGNSSLMFQPSLDDVEFLGHSLKAQKGLAWLHQKTGSPIVPILMHENGRAKQELIVSPALELTDEQHSRETLRAIFDVLESYIREFPEQWKQWKTLHLMADYPASSI